MPHLLRLLTLAALLCCWFNPTLAQAPKSDAQEVMRALLSLPAPTPRTAQNTDSIAGRFEHSPTFFEKNHPPPDDAPLDDVLDYWKVWAQTSDRPEPSEIIRRRLLDACSDDYLKLPQFLSVFPADESTAKRVKEIFDKATSDQLKVPWWFEQVKNWLVLNSKFFLNDLLTLASKVKDDDGSVKHEEELVALSELDWQLAEPLIKTVAAGNQPRASALAFTLLYKQAVTAKNLDGEEKYRNDLKLIASDRSAPAAARNTAIVSLSETDWSGRDDWYLSLLADDSLRELSDVNYGFSPLTELFDRDPEKWIPVMIRLVESKDRVVQQAAASLLVIYGTAHPRRDVVLPVLPWLSDPDWLELSHGQRTAFIGKMDKIDLPESVPGLIWIVENEESDRPWAARALARYKDPRAVPVIKKALAASEEGHRRIILEGFVPAGGIPDSEAIAALEAYVTSQATSPARNELDRYVLYDDPTPLPVTIGKYLANMAEVPDSLPRSVLARAESLKKTNPAMAQSLLAIANKWRSRDIDLDMIQRIAAGTADADTIVTALQRNPSLHESLGAELQMMLATSDEPLGIGAVLLDDSQVAQTILTSENQRSQIALLAAARLIQTPLPVELVGKLLPSKNALLALAAERYLLAEDSLAARKVLWEHHPDDAFVTGWRENGPFIGSDNVAAMTKTEEKLRAELLKKDGPLQIFALIPNSDRYSRVLRIYPNKAIYTLYEDPARIRERVVSDAELATFKEFIGNSGLHDQGPTFGPCHHDCAAAEFVELKKNGAWRVFSHQGFGGWLSLIVNLDNLGRGEGVKFRYELEEQIKGLEILFADDRLKARNVWQRGDEIRIFVEREETEEDVQQRNSADSEDDDEDDKAARERRRRKEVERVTARFSWRRLTDNKAGAVVAKPEIFASFGERKSIIDDNDYVDGVFTPDGKWLVAEKRGSDWSQPHHFVRRNLQTGREFLVNLNPADQSKPIAFLPLHNKILLRRAKAEIDRPGRVVTGPDQPEYRLIDPQTGVMQLVSGEFLPLHQKGLRFLQPTNQPHEFWAAIPDEKKNQTEVGRYNLKDFSFKPVLVVPQINFSSLSMWVDESHGKLYVVYENQLLRLPLKP